MDCDVTSALKPLPWCHVKHQRQLLLRNNLNMEQYNLFQRYDTKHWTNDFIDRHWEQPCVTLSIHDTINMCPFRIS